MPDAEDGLEVIDCNKPVYGASSSRFPFSSQFSPCARVKLGSPSNS
jgi:hypothetical protein